MGWPQVILVFSTTACMNYCSPLIELSGALVAAIDILINFMNNLDRRKCHVIRTHPQVFLSIWAFVSQLCTICVAF